MENHVSPSGISVTVSVQGFNSDVERMIRFLSLSKKAFLTKKSRTSNVFQKIYENRKRVEVVDNVLYRQYSYNVANLAFGQIIVPP